MILLDRLDGFVNSSCALLSFIVDEAALRYAVQALHDSGLDQTYRSVHVVILNAWDQNFLALLQQILLNRSDVRNVAYILVESRVDSHVFGSHRKPFTVLIFVLDVEDEGDARRILAHHFLQKAHSQMDALDDQRLVPLVERFDDFGELLGYQRALLLVAVERDPVF